MTYTRAIGVACNTVIRLIVRGLALSRIHPNVLTFIGLVINGVAAVLLAAGLFVPSALVMIGAGIFDMVDGRVARATNQVTLFGAFFDSVVDRYSDLVLLMGLLVYYASINRFFYVLLIIGALFNRMAPVLWVIAVIANITVIHRMLFTYRATQPLERSRAAAAVSHQPTAVS